MCSLASSSILEHQTILKVWWRTVPLLVGALFFSFLDRVNIGFAALQMNTALGFSNTVFGTGTGFFAIGYALAAIPSTLLLHRFGARRWISLIIVAWGLCSAATAFVTSPGELLAARMLLGMAEAGFAPGTILYLSCWFPDEYRGRVMGSFFFIQPIALLIGGPVSTALLTCSSPFGLAGWQWLFILEALPAVPLAVAVFSCLTDRPADARWLTETEREYLTRQMSLEHRKTAQPSPSSSIVRTLTDARVWALALVYLGMGTCGIGTTIFLPLILKSMGISIDDIGYAAALPALVSALLLPVWGMWADRTTRREVVVIAGCGAMAIGLIASATLLPSTWALASLCIAMTGFYGCLVAFWTLPGRILNGAGAATGLAFITIVGNLGNFTGPALIGQVSDLSQSYAAALSWLAVIAVAIAVIAYLQAATHRRRTRADQINPWR